MLSVSRLEPDVPAELNAPNVVMLSTCNPLIMKHLKGASAALRLHVLESILRVIERSLHELDPEGCDRAVQASLIEWFAG